MPDNPKGIGTKVVGTVLQKISGFRFHRMDEDETRNSPSLCSASRDRDGLTKFSFYLADLTSQVEVIV
jgi:hypothetical protein